MDHVTGNMNDPRNITEVHAISSAPLELRRWSSAKNGQRDGSGHPVACAYLEQSPKACLAPSPLTPLQLLELHQIRSPHRYRQLEHVHCTLRDLAMA